MTSLNNLFCLICNSSFPPNKKRHHMTDRDCKTLLFVEMCARVVKNNLRLRLRERMRKLRLPLDEPYHRLVVDYLNLILGHNDQSEEYWAKNLKSSLMRYLATLYLTTLLISSSRKFDLALTSEESEPSFPLKCILDYFSDNSMVPTLAVTSFVANLIQFRTESCCYSIGYRRYAVSNSANE